MTKVKEFEKTVKRIVITQKMIKNNTKHEMNSEIIIIDNTFV